MTAIKLATVALMVALLSGCQTKAQSASPLESAEPIILGIQEEFNGLPNSYFHPLAKDLVIGVQVALFKIQRSSKVFIGANGKRYIKTADDLMIEIGALNDAQLEVVGELYHPILTSPILTNAIIKFSNKNSNSFLAQTIGDKDFVALSKSCARIMSQSALTETNDLSLRHNALLNPENFKDIKRFKDNQKQTADFIQSGLRRLFNKEIPSIEANDVVRPAVEYCVSLDYELGKAMKEASEAHLKATATSQPSADKEVFERLVGLTRLAGMETGNKVTPKKQTYSVKQPEDNDKASKLIRCKTASGNERIVTRMFCTERLQGRVIN